MTIHGDDLCRIGADAPIPKAPNLFAGELCALYKKDEARIVGCSDQESRRDLDRADDDGAIGRIAPGTGAQPVAY